VRAARVMLQRSRAPRRRSCLRAAVCHFSHWRLRDFDGMYSLEVPRPQMPYRVGMIPVVVTRCIEAAIELEQLRLTTAERLALDCARHGRVLCGPACRHHGIARDLVPSVV